jgi:hypothetical protein
MELLLNTFVIEIKVTKPPIIAIGHGVGKPSLLIIISPATGTTSKDKSNNHFVLNSLVSFIKF